MVLPGSNFFGGSLACALSSQAGVSRAGGTTFYSMSYISTTSGIASYWQQWYACVNAANAAIISISALADNKFPIQKKKSNDRRSPLFPGMGKRTLVMVFRAF
ncbi:MAG: hypothetical protein V8R91_18585 [Butyricimonas faecihominis]